MENEERLVMKLGPIPNFGSSVVKEIIVSDDLKANQVYSVKVKVEMYSLTATVSNKHYFSKK